MRRFAPLIKKHLTQAQCAELLEHSLSFQKDLERCRCSPSIENFYHICRTLDISADDCIFQDSHDRTDSTYQALLRLLPLCDQRGMSVLVATASALAENDASVIHLDTESKQTEYVKNRKASSSDWYLCHWLFCVMPYENFVFIPVVL